MMTFTSSSTHGNDSSSTSQQEVALESSLNPATWEKADYHFQVGSVCQLYACSLFAEAGIIDRAHVIPGSLGGGGKHVAVIGGACLEDAVRGVLMAVVA